MLSDEFQPSIDPSELRRDMYAYICIAAGKSLNMFSMQSLNLQIKIHPSIQPLITHPIRCHREDIYFNTAVTFQLNQLQFPAEDLDIKIELHSHHLVSSQHIATCYCPLENSQLDMNFRKPLYYFYKQSHLPFFDDRTGDKLAILVVTIAFGYEEHLNYVEPSMKFNSVLLKYKNPNTDSNPMFILETEEEDEENWDNFDHNKKYSPITERDLKKSLSINNLSSNSTDDEDSSISSENLENSTLKNLLSPCTTPIKEINKLLDEDIDHENRIDLFIQKKMFQMTPRSEIKKRRVMSLTPFQKDKLNRFSTPPGHIGSPIKRSPSIDRIINGEDDIMNLHLSSSSDESNDDFSTPKRRSHFHK